MSLPTLRITGVTKLRTKNYNPVKAILYPYDAISHKVLQVTSLTATLAGKILTTSTQYQLLLFPSVELFTLLSIHKRS